MIKLKLKKKFLINKKYSLYQFYTLRMNSFLPLNPIIIDDEFSYCYIKKNNRVMLYCEFYSYGPAHNNIQFVYIDFTINKSNYVINNSIMFYYDYAKKRYDHRNIIYGLAIHMIKYYLINCGYSKYKKIIYTYNKTLIPDNILIFFENCMNDKTL